MWTEIMKTDIGVIEDVIMQTHINLNWRDDDEDDEDVVPPERDF